MKQTLMVLAVLSGLAAPAVAQTINPSGPLYREGTAYLAAKAVTGVTDNQTSKVMSFSLTLLNNTTVVVNLNYATPVYGQIMLMDSINPQVAELMRMLADKKRTDPGNFYYFYMNPVKWRSFGGSYQYWVSRSTVVSLDAVIPVVHRVDSGSNTRGGLVRAVVYDNVVTGADGLAFSSYGYVTLQRVDPTATVEFDAYMLRQPLATPDKGTLQPLTPRPGLTYDAYKFMRDALTARQLVILSAPLAAYKIIDARIVYDGCGWTTSLN